MKKLMLEDHGRLYTETQRRPDARLFTAGELVRFSSGEDGLPRGTVLRVDGIDGPNQTVHLRRRSGEVVRWSPTEEVQVFSPSEGEVKRGTVFEWSRSCSQTGAEQGDLGRVVDIHPTRGVTVRSNKLGDVRFSLDPGTWHHAITRQGIVGHLREAGDHRLESYRDVGPIPEAPTHDEPFHRLGQPYSMLTHGAPPSLEVLARGDLVYFASAEAADIPVKGRPN